MTVQAPSSPQHSSSPLSGHGILFLEEYDHTSSEASAISTAFSTIKTCFDPTTSNTVPAKLFHQAVRVIENNTQLDTKEIHELLKQAPKHILEDTAKNAVFQRLFVRCLALEVDNAVNFFQSVLTPKGNAHIEKDDLARNAQICAVVVRCFSLLKTQTQQEMKKVLTLLENQPEDTFTDPIKFKIYKCAAFIFTELNVETNVELEDLTSSEEIIKVSAPLPNQPAAGTPAVTAETAPTTPVSIIIPTNLADSIICPNDLFEIIVKHSPPGTEQKGLNSRLEQFRSISRFGKSLLIDYGPQILERTSGALIEALKTSKNRDLLVDLIININAPQLVSSPENPFSKKLSSVLRKALQKRMPDLIKDVVGYTTKTLRDPHDGPEFVTLAMEYLTPLCFQETTASPEFKKQLLVTLLSSVKEFMGDLNSSLEELAKTHKEPLDIKDEELKLIHLMNTRIKAKGLPLIVPDHMNSAMMKENVLTVVQTLLKSFMSPTPEDPSSFTAKQQLLLFILSLYLNKIVDRIFSPDTLCVLIDRILENPLSLTSTVNPPTPPLDGRLDEKYTTRLSNLFHDMALEVVKMGGTPIFLKAIIELIDPIIKSKLNKVAIDAHKSLEEVMRTPFLSDTVITPVLILDQILYNKIKPAKDGEKVQRIPVLNMMQFLSDTPPDVDTIRKRVNADIKKKPYANIKSLIDANVSVPVSIGLKVLPVESFCQNLTDRVYRLSQQEMLMKMLFGYLSYGITQMIKKPTSAK